MSEDRISICDNSLNIRELVITELPRVIVYTLLLTSRRKIDSKADLTTLSSPEEPVVANETIRVKNSFKFFIYILNSTVL